MYWKTCLCFGILPGMSWRVGEGREENEVGLGKPQYKVKSVIYLYLHLIEVIIY